MSWPGEGTRYEFPNDWDWRATAVVKDFETNLAELNYSEVEEALQDRFDSRFSLNDEATTYFSDLLLLSSVLYTSTYSSLPNLKCAMDASPRIWELVKFGVSFVLDAARGEDLTKPEFDRGRLSQVHKAICELLFESVTERYQSRRLTLSNNASELQLGSGSRDLYVSFSIDGDIDGGGMTIAAMAPTWLDFRGLDFPDNSEMATGLSNDRFSAGFATVREYGDFDQDFLVSKLNFFYGFFRSVGPLAIQLDCEPQSAWNLVLKSLEPIAADIQIELPSRPKLSFSP